MQTDNRYESHPTNPTELLSDTSENTSQYPSSALPLRLLGFGVLLGWHFLILFFPFDAADAGIDPSLLLRQVVLNFSLCVFFFLGGYFLEKSSRYRMRTPGFLAAAAIMATLGNINILVAPSLLGALGVVVSVALMGAGEAALMLSWLQFYSETSINYSGRYLAASAVIGSLICFFARHLTLEISLVVFVALPPLSAIMLFLASCTESLRENDEGGEGLPDWPSAREPFVRSTAQLVVFSFAFGLFQGCVSPTATLLPMSEPTAILGVGIAGAAVVALYWVTPTKPDLRPIHKASILLFVAGILAAPFSEGTFARLAATATMTGFLLYDILILVFAVDLIRTFDLRATFTLGLNRSLEYGSFAIGICLGVLVWNSASQVANLPYVLSAVASFVSFAATLFLMTEKNTWYADAYAIRKPDAVCAGVPSAPDKPEAALPLDAHQAACESVCVRFGLTPREQEVFMLLAKGRNAEFIQNALVISNHTVKTHISNIYKKIDVHSAQELLDTIDCEKETDESEK